MTRTMQKQWRQTNIYQCPNCRSLPNSRILCCKCEKGFRLNHNRASSGVCDVTAHLKCTALSRRERERLKGGLRSWSYCNIPATMTIQNSDFLHPLHQPAMKSIGTPITFQSLLTLTCSECHRVIKKSCPRKTCTTWGKSRHQTCTYLLRRERESIRDGCRELHCRGTDQSPSTSTMPSRSHPTPSQISESTMLQEVPIIHPKIQEDGVTTQPIPQKKSEATNRLLDGAPCSACTIGIGQGGRKLVCWSCNAQYHFNCMMLNRTQIVQTQTTQIWQCTHCSQNPVADCQANQMAPLLDKKSPGVHQYQPRILKWNANCIHRELPLLEVLLEATNVDVICIQETKLQPKEMTLEQRLNAVRGIRPVQREARGGSL